MDVTMMMVGREERGGGGEAGGDRQQGQIRASDGSSLACPFLFLEMRAGRESI